MKLDILKNKYSVKDIEILLLRSDWYRWEKACPIDVEPGEIKKIAELIFGYINGSDDCVFCYTNGEGFLVEDSISNYLSTNELNIRCIAMGERMGAGPRFAASLMYFRYCYDHTEYMELTQLKHVLLRDGEHDSDAYIHDVINIMINLEQEYDTKDGYSMWSDQK